MNKPALAIDLGGTKIKIGLVQAHVVVGATSIDALSANGLRERAVGIMKSMCGLEAANRCHIGLFIEVISGFAIGARDYQAGAL